MKAMVEFHILQNYAPANINRDDTGSPKEAVFGGVVRGRISSQSMKRAIRTHMLQHQLLDPSNLGVRTQLVSGAITDELEHRGRDRQRASEIVEFALGGAKLSFEDGRSQYLLFLGRNEISSIADVINEHWDELSTITPTTQAVSETEAVEGGKTTKKTAKDKKTSAKAAVPAEVSKKISSALDGGKAVDVALFGRMVADSHDITRDASCQIAHAISTNRIEREFDFFTAVDDLQDKDNAGAGMLGTVEFNSSCYYRYGVVDVQQLLANLGGDVQIALAGLKAFLESVIDAKPTGKQNTFAAHQPPSFVAFSVRQGGVPVALTNAFEKPIRPLSDESLVDKSAAALKGHHEKLNHAYGYAINASIRTLNLTNSDSIIGDRVETVDDLVAATVTDVGALLGVK